MTDQTEAQYFRMRAKDERTRSQQASSSPAATAHAELADRYEQLAAQFEAESGSNGR